MVTDFYTPLSASKTISRKKIIKSRENMSNAINQYNLIYRKFHWMTAEYIIFKYKWYPI